MTNESRLSGRHVVLLAAGKAAVPMANAFVAHAANRPLSGLVITPMAGVVPAPLAVMAAAHPLPDGRSELAGRAALAVAASVTAGQVLVVLLSGGASALMAVPAAGLTLEDKRAVTACLLQAGADIQELNTVRKHLSAIKGGRLAAACNGEVIAWLLSDVVGDDPSIIASGPTWADPTTFREALDVLDRRGGRRAYPSSVVRHLEGGSVDDETPKPGSSALARAVTTVIGSARLSLEGASLAARALGCHVVMRPAPVVGEARVAAREHFEWMAATIRNHDESLCLLSSGETTVTVRGSGRGGRNQEFGLALAGLLPALGRPVQVASVGTDGVDGPTDAAGARVDDTTTARARAQGLDLEAALDANDSWSVFGALGDLIRTGPTGTNVGDLQVVLVGPRSAE
jgi:glycerate 2-kinase